MILLICGPPAVGKTTLATRLRDRLAERGRAFALAHSDEFSRRTYERLFDRVAAAPDRDWLLDGTFYRREWRDRFRALDDVRTVRLVAPLDVCLRRNREREDPIDEQGVHVVYREFDPPDADLVLDAAALTPDEAVERALDAVRRWERGDADP